MTSYPFTIRHGWMMDGWLDDKGQTDSWMNGWMIKDRHTEG